MSEISTKTREEQYAIGEERRKALGDKLPSNFRGRPLMAAKEILEQTSLSLDSSWTLQVFHNKSGEARIRFCDLAETGGIGEFLKMKSVGDPDKLVIFLEDSCAVKGKKWICCTRLASSFDLEATKKQPFRKDVNTISLGFPGGIPSAGGGFSCKQLIDASIILRCTWDRLYDVSPDVYKIPHTWFADRCIPPNTPVEVLLTQKIVFDMAPEKMFDTISRRIAQEDKRLVIASGNKISSDDDNDDGRKKGSETQKRKESVQSVSGSGRSDDVESGPSSKKGKKPKVTLAALKMQRFQAEHEQQMELAQDFKATGSLPDVILENLPHKGLARKVDMKRARTIGEMDLLADDVVFNFDELKGKYILPMDDFIMVPVELIESPGEVYGCRKFDKSKAVGLEDVMVRNVIQFPQFADLLPIVKKEFDERNRIVVVNLAGKLK